MKRKKIRITGVSDSRSAKVISDVMQKNKQYLIIVSGRSRAEKLAADLSFFCNRSISVLPPEEQVFINFEAKNNDNSVLKMKALKTLSGDDEAIIIAPVSAAVKKLIPHTNFESKVITISSGDEFDIENIKRNLAGLGYERADITLSPGQFSVRGGIIDIFSPNLDDPFRIELFGTEIDSIRTYDPETQRSIENLQSAEIYPAREIMKEDDVFDAGRKKIEAAYNAQINLLLENGKTEQAENLKERLGTLIEDIDTFDNAALLENYIHYFYDEYEFIWDYMKDCCVIFDDPLRIFETLDLREKESNNDFEMLLERGLAVPEDMKLISGKGDLFDVLSKEQLYFIMPFESELDGIDTDETIAIRCGQTTSFSGHLETFENELKKDLEKGFDVLIGASSSERAKTLSDFISRFDSGRVSVREGALSSGMIFYDAKLVIYSDNDIFATSRLGKRRKRRFSGSKLRTFADLEKDDFVVHENHGIGKFLGIEALTVQGTTKDYLKIQYSGADMLYVPVEQMDIVQKYIGSEGMTPKMSKLSSDEWKLTKARAKAAIAEMTEELIELYAARKAVQGYAFGPDTVWQKEFEDAFPYDETEDQLNAIEEIKRDMEKPEAMDRLLCGDVGYGKTEVAARAIFKCVTEGKQVAVLVPTTILANQHYQTIKNRFSAFPITVDMLSRFRTEKQQDMTVEGLIKGKVDVVIGTHRLLSGDVKFRDLGLLVIDEEQRFGVAHKEKLKRLKTNVDVLVLSATPIPRTLNMSLTGIKDMSLISEPPGDRYPVQTYVTDEDDITIREVINRELDRDGQVFVVYNRVRGISRLAERIASLVPEAKIAVGHGQMSEHALEEVMKSFISGESNVLVATTIIESGIDIPNANTMIIIDSDKCGLSQLYQLRGRVGRSNRIAYAYLMHRKNKNLTEIAEKRLKAIKDFTEFGAGFKIAMRDMELRGAGNLLGAEQSGHMMSIGYELYCKLVDEAVKRSRGESIPESSDDLNIELSVPANIPSWYIENETLKLQMYKKIAEIFSESDAEELIDELLDRFGDLPKETLNLINISRMRALASRLGVLRIFEQNDKVIITFDRTSPLKAYALMKVDETFGRRVFFHGGVDPLIKLSYAPKRKTEETISLLQILYDFKDKTAEK